jgi:hypothetical protein
MRKEWLTKRTTVAEAEAEDLAFMKCLYESEGEVLPANFKPFEHPPGKWDKLVANMQPGDELWWFMNSAEAWAGLCGCKGLAVVRQGEMVDYFVTMRS